MSNWLRRIIILLLFTGFGKTSQASDSLLVLLDKYQLEQGDSLQLEAWLLNYTKETNATTLQVWIDNIGTGKRWKFRYPLINGHLVAFLRINESIPDGRYAINFLLQKDFFNVKGQLKNGDKREDKLNYLVISKNRQTIIDQVELDNKREFKLGYLLFKDTALFIFSPPKRNRVNDLSVDISTSLDSSFVPAAVQTEMITVGSDTMARAGSGSPSNYSFTYTKKDFRNVVLEEVIVKTTKKMLDKFEKENVSGMFSGDATTIDGLGSDDLANSPDLFMFLQSRIPGLRMSNDSETGLPALSWRGQATDIYVNEILVNDFSPYDINPADIAMIKVFRPGTFVSSGRGDGGSIAIYTRNGAYAKTGNRKYSFYLKGYTGLEEEWK